jgi:signal transduction histidine kinase
VKIELNNAGCLQNVCDKLDNCIKYIRDVAHNLIPGSLQFGLKTALEDFVTQFPNAHFYFFGQDRRMGERIEFIIYCCANELVTNSINHSKAKSIKVQLIQNKKCISLTVHDDGCGFDENRVVKGNGLKNVHDRVISCNGKIHTVTSPGNGTETTIELDFGNMNKLNVEPNMSQNILTFVPKHTIPNNPDSLSSPCFLKSDV